MAKQTTGRRYGADCAYATEDEEARVLFNSGYHDGVQASKNGWSPLWKAGQHFSPAYETGYWMGVDDQGRGDYTGNSTVAWDEVIRLGGYLAGMGLRVRATDTVARVRPTHAEITKRTQAIRFGAAVPS